jgi:hypothetical protein
MESWSRPLRKTIYTLVVNDYSPVIRALTFPLMKAYAAKIGAEFFVITERRFPDWPVTYEKMQIAELGRIHRNDWNIFLDADTLVHPECFDITDHLRKDTVCHNGKDMAGIRWTYDAYFRRDGRNFGSCNWCTIASDWCLDLWRPLGISLGEALANIHITVNEHLSGNCWTEHLIDDYALSRNIARFGLKATTVIDVCQGLGFRTPDGRGVSPYLWHIYTVPEREKIEMMLTLLGKKASEGGWELMTADDIAEFRGKWELK